MLHKIFRRAYIQVIQGSRPAKNMSKESDVDSVRRNQFFVIGYSGILTVALFLTGKFLD
jgi:hypothetical protein